MNDNAEYQHIYAVVRRIPKGRVATYGQIATLAGMPKHARLVGYALRNTPPNRRLPWHRVVNAQGKVSQRSRSGSEGVQYTLLEDEGIEFDERGKIDLERFQWKPRK